MNTTNENSSSAENNDYVFRYVLVGDSGVGKSSVMHHLMFNKCLPIIYFKLVKKETTQTIGMEFSSKIINLGNRDVKLQIWDTAGQEKFRSVTRSHYRGAIGVIIFYDITK
jgi:Ras-related protein Rab-4B